MVFVGAAVLPHGALPFDGDPNSDSIQCRERHSNLPDDLARLFNKLYEGTCKAAEELVDLDPDLIILHTPHGISLGSSVGVYLADSAEGTAEWNGCWDDFKVKLSLDMATAESLVSHLQDDGVAVEGIQAFSGFPQPLRWGEVIPCWYIQRRLRKDVQFVIMSRSLRDRRTNPCTVDKTHLNFGKSLSQFVQRLAQRVAVVVSGDLSHTHESKYTDPLYMPSPSAHLVPKPEVSLQLDQALIAWSKSGASSKEHFASRQSWDPQVALSSLATAAPLNADGYACGFVGMVMLHALLDDQVSTGAKISSSFFTWQAPTYYGMMAVTFSKE